MSMTVMFLLSEKSNDCFYVLIDDIWRGKTIGESSSVIRQRQTTYKTVQLGRIRFENRSGGDGLRKNS